MPFHIAIVQAQYVRPILDGVKTIECRLARNAGVPFGQLVPGQRIYLKQSAGPFFATAVADQVWSTDRLTPERIDQLRDEYDSRILGGDYWGLKRETARYATLIWLRDVEPWTDRIPYRPQNIRAWYVLDDELNPLARRPSRRQPVTAKPFDVPLTPGCLRQRHVRLGPAIEHFPSDCIGGTTRAQAGRPITLHLHDGPSIATDIVGPRKMIRWRGWGEWFEQSGLQPGDRLRFTPQAKRSFAVRVVKSPLPV